MGVIRWRGLYLSLSVSRAFNDPDGHGWGPFWMDAAGMPAQD